MHVTDLPIEIIEKILFYLNMKDLSSWFSVSDKCSDMVSNLFWKKVCKRDGFSSSFLESDSTEDKYWACVNLKLCRYKIKKHCIENIPVCIYNSTLISSSDIYNSIQVWNIIGSELVLAQTLPPGKIIAFKSTLAIQNSKSVVVHEFDHEEKIYKLLTYFECSLEDKINIDNMLMVIYLLKFKEFLIFYLADNNQVTVPCPDDVLFLLSMYTYKNRLYIVTATSSGFYKIKVFDTLSKAWVLDIACCGRVCSSRNEPNIWVNECFIVSTGTSFRGTNEVIYHELKIYKSDGTFIKMLDIVSSRKHYFHCCFSNDTIIVTTAPKRIAVVKEDDTYEFSLLDDQYINILSAPGNIIIAAYKTYFETYDGKLGEPLYSVQLGLFSIDRILFNSRFFIACSSNEKNMCVLNFTSNQYVKN